MKRSLTLVASIVIVLLVLAAAFFGLRAAGYLGGDGSLQKDSGDGISDYSAVFLTNNQIYFGKIYGSDENTVDLRDIYYLRVDQDLQNGASPSPSPSASADQTNIVLVKLGDELHGPNDRMQINRDQVLFTESLKDNSKVVEAIKNYRK